MDSDSAIGRELSRGDWQEGVSSCLFEWGKTGAEDWRGFV